MKIAVAGTGYVGMSLAILLAQHNEVIAVDVIPEKVEKINNRISPIQDNEIEEYLASKKLNLVATLDGASAYKEAEYVIIAAPTNYDSQKNFFDTSAVEAVIELVLSVNPNAVMVIKSTIPVGYTEAVRKNTTVIISSSVLSFCGNRKRYMIICIHRVLSLAALVMTSVCVRRRNSLHSFCRKLQSKRISIL